MVKYMLIRLIYPENWINTFRQIPNYEINSTTAKIGKITFTTDEVDEADLAVIINYTPKKLQMKAREAWIFHHEPGNYKYFAHWQKAYPCVDRVFGTWRNCKTMEKYPNSLKNLVQTQPSILWQCPNSYDFYKNLNRKEKDTNLSAIVSSKTNLPGHKERLDFLFNLKEEFKNTEYNFNIVGRGISEFNSKDDILIPSKYTLAIENTSEPHYFSEKITDAFLCNTMPIYFGAPNIFEYFPKNSLVLLDDLDFKKAKEIIKYTIDNNLYEKNKDSIMTAKNMVLNKYNLFMNIIEKIAEYDISNKPIKEIIVKKRHQMRHPVISKIKNKIKEKVK